MSQFAIPTIADEDLDMSISPQLGEETRVKFSYSPVYQVGSIEMDAAGSGTLYNERTYRAPTNPSVGRDMQVICDGPVLSAAQIVVTLGVTFAVGAAVNITGVSAANPAIVTTATAHGLTSGQSVVISGVSGSTPSVNNTYVVTVIDSTHFSIPVTVSVAGTGGTMQQIGTGQAVATFNPPETANDTSFNFPPGLSVDLLPSAPNTGLQIRSINSIVSVAGGSSGAKFLILAIPDLTTFTEIACVVDKNIDIKAPKSVAIACRYDSSRWVKRGRDEVPKMDIKAKWNSAGDGLGRVNGQKVTILLENWINDTILNERLIVSGWRPTVKKTSGDGDAEAMGDATGMYEMFASFV